VTGQNLEEEDDSENSDGLESDSENGEEAESKEKKPYGDVLYAGMDKKERKQKVKDEKKEKRQNKVPKHVKKAFKSKKK